MFEQSYQSNTTAEPVREGDFLFNYEIRSWELSPRVYKILGASLLLNLVAIAIFGQASFLTAKGCDSPLVGRVCQVLDTVYLGTVLFGTERQYADLAYERTQLDDMDVTFVDVSGMPPPLEYPEGYFQIANPEQAFSPDAQFQLAPGFIAPGIPANPVPSTGSLIDTPQVLPKANDNAVVGDLPTFGDSPSTNPTRKGRGRIRNRPADGNVAVADANANANTTANPTVDPNAQNANAAPVDEATQDQYGVFINKRPLKDRAKDTIELVDDKKVKLDSIFKVIITGTLGYGKDGKTVVLKNPKPVPVDKNIPNDPAMVKLVQDWIIAVGDAGWLGYLDRLDDKKVKSRKVVISIEQNDENLVASVQSELATPEEAQTKASSFALLLSGASLAASGDEQAFLKSASTTSDGRNMIVNFTIPKPIVQEMIQRKLAEAKAPTGQPNSTAVVGPNNNTAARR
jgi:hypothetical protein